jgi:hypothetical protein
MEIMVGDYVRILTNHSGYEYLLPEGTAGRIGRITRVNPTRTRGVRLHVSRFTRGAHNWAAFSPEHLAPATEEDWTAQKMIDELGR